MATPNLPSKRHISFYSNKEYTSVCRGINLKSRCTNPACESVRSMGGLVIVKCPDSNTCVYQDAVYDLPCPSCGTVLSPMQFSGVVFVRCEARVSIGDKSELIKANQEETVSYDIEYIGPEVRIRILERESENPPPPAPSDISGNDLLPTKGLNLVGTCRFKDCLAFKNNQGRVIVKVGLIGSGTFQELVKFRNCPSCNKGLDPDSFTAVIFLCCKAEIELGRNVETFDATSRPKPFQIDVAGPPALIRLNPDPIPTSSESPAPVQPPPAFQIPDIGIPSSLDEAKGGFKIMQNLLQIMPALKEIKPSDFGFGNLGMGDLSLGDLNEGLLNLLQNESSDESDESSKTEMEPGINFMADCPNSKCGSVVIPSGHIVSCQFKEAIRGMTCPSCKQGLPSTSFTGVGFLNCKASVMSGEERSVYQAGKTPEICRILPEEFDAEITVLERDLTAESTGQLGGGNKSYARVCSGLNIEAVCVNPKCNASGVVIPCPKVQECQYYDLIPTLTCPACNHKLPLGFFVGFSLVRCQAEVTIGSRVQTVEAKGDKTKDFRIELGGPPVSIKILSRHTSEAGELSGESGKEYTTACSGLNIIADCHNAKCLAYKENGGQVIIQAPDATECLLSDTASDLNCPSCTIAMEYSQVKAITFVRCGGEVIIGDQIEKFRAAGDHTVDFMVDPDGPEVIINISYKAQEKEESDSSDRKYTKVCDGVNFEAFCENPDCLAVQENHGFVNVKRDDEFIQKGGFPPNRCNYSVEVQHLKCPSCGSHLDPKFARGVALVRCKGMIEIAGKRQNFEARTDDPLKFKLDHSDPRNFVEYEVVSVLPHGPGLNVTFKCPNSTCPDMDHPLLNELAFIKFGTVTGFKVNEMMLNRACPHCESKIAIDNIKDILFNKCTAVVRINGEETSYLTSSRVVAIKFDVSENIVVDILPVIARDISEMSPHGNPFFSMNTGLNLQVICSEPVCEAKQKHEGRVCISCPESKNSQLSELLSLLFCPSCNSPLSDMPIFCLSFYACKSLIESSEKKYLIEAASDEVIDLEGSLLSPDLSIQVLSLDEDFPKSDTGCFHKDSDYSHASL